ncbi:MAG: alpha/beta fold hydrolase [Solirubrobacteraceae bacterium]
MSEISPALYRAGDGEPLVLVHGFTATWRCWHPVLADLVAQFDVIAPTLHGHDGGPELPAGAAHTIPGAADHLETLLDELGVGTAHFAGNSMGGALSLELAKRGRARSVVAISPGGGWEASDRAEAQRIIRWFTRNQRLARATETRMPRLMRRPGTRRVALRDVMTRGDQVPAEEAIALVRSSTRCSVVDDVFATIRSGEALLTDLDRIACPVLVAWGDRDRILPMARHSARFQREIPGVEFRVLPGVGHTPMWDAPGLIAGLIAQFARRVPVAG